MMPVTGTPKSRQCEQLQYFIETTPKIVRNIRKIQQSLEGQFRLYFGTLSSFIVRTHIARTRHFVPVTFKVKWKTRRRSSRLRTACHWAYSKTAKKFFEFFSIQIEYCTSVRTVRPYETRAEEKLFSFVTNGVVRQSRRGPYPLPRPPPSSPPGRNNFIFPPPSPSHSFIPA